MLKINTKKILAYFNSVNPKYSIWVNEDNFITQACIAYAVSQCENKKILIIGDCIATSIDYQIVLSQFSKIFPKLNVLLLCPDTVIDEKITEINTANVIVCASACLEQFLLFLSMKTTDSPVKFDHILMDDAAEIFNESSKLFLETIKHLNDFSIKSHNMTFLVNKEAVAVIDDIAHCLSVDVATFENLSDYRLRDHSKVTLTSQNLTLSEPEHELKSKPTSKPKSKPKQEKLIASSEMKTIASPDLPDVEITIKPTTKSAKLKTQIISFEPELQTDLTISDVQPKAKLSKKKVIETVQENLCIPSAEVTAPATLVLSQETGVQPKNNFPKDTIPYALMVERPLKRSLLIQLIMQRDWQKVVIVTRTKHSAHRLEEKLFHSKLRARIIHGTLAPSAVEKNIEKFKNNEIRAIIVTDNALGLVEYPQLDAVVFFELPDLVETFFERMTLFKDFTHDAEKISLFCNDEAPWLDNLNQVSQQKICVKPCQDLIALIGQNARKEYQNKTEKNKAHPPREAARGVLNKRMPLRGALDSPAVRTDVQVNPDQNSDDISGVEANAAVVKSTHKNPRVSRTDNPRQKNAANKVQTGRTRNLPRPKFNRERSDDSNNGNYEGNNEQQGIVNQNRLPFELDSFEANIARENKRRNRNMYSGNSQNYSDSFDKALFEQKPKDSGGNTVKVSQRKRRTIDPDNIGNQ